MLFAHYRRLERKLTKEYVAEATGLRPSVIRGIEQGRTNPTQDELKKLAKVLECQASDLLRHVSAALLPPGTEARDYYEDQESRG